MIRFEYAVIVTAATAAVMLAYSPAEPYAAVIAVLLPPVFVLALVGAARGGDADAAAGRRWSASGCSSAWPRCSTRCCSGFAAFTLAIMGGRRSRSRRRSWQPLLRLAVIAVHRPASSR